MELQRIPLSELQVRHVYRLRARNLNIGVWTGRSWIGIREKFGDTFLDDCEVPEHTAWAVEPVGSISDEIALTCYLKPSICQICRAPVNFDESRGTEWYERWKHIDNPEEDADHYARSISVRNHLLYDALMTFERATTHD